MTFLIHENFHYSSLSARTSFTKSIIASSDVNPVFSASFAICAWSNCIAYIAELMSRTLPFSTTNVIRSPLEIPRISRTSFGIVTCHFDITFALSINVLAIIIKPP